MKTLAALLLLISAVLVAPTAAHACSCNMPDVQSALANSGAVFEGRVLSFTVDGDGAVARLRVTQTWKGANAEEVDVTTIAHESMCGVPFTVGSVWLVYAEGTEGALSTGICHRTRLRDQAGEDIPILGAGVTPVDPAGPSPVDDEEEEEPVEAPGSRGGCASCNAGGTQSAAAFAAFALPVLLMFRRRR